MSNEKPLSEKIANYSTPVSTTSSEMMTTITQTLVEVAPKAPEEACKLVETCLKTKNETLRDTNNYKLKVEEEKTKRIAMGLFLSIIITVMVYAGFTGDKELSETIIDISIAALGGLGAGAALTKRKEK